MLNTPSRGAGTAAVFAVVASSGHPAQPGAPERTGVAGAASVPSSVGTVLAPRCRVLRRKSCSLISHIDESSHFTRSIRVTSGCCCIRSSNPSCCNCAGSAISTTPATTEALQTDPTRAGCHMNGRMAAPCAGGRSCSSCCDRHGGSRGSGPGSDHTGSCDDKSHWSPCGGRMGHSTASCSTKNLG